MQRLQICSPAGSRAELKTASHPRGVGFVKAGTVSVDGEKVGSCLAKTPCGCRSPLPIRLTAFALDVAVDRSATVTPAAEAMFGVTVTNRPAQNANATMAKAFTF